MGERRTANVIADRRGEGSDTDLRRHRRTACVECATQPREGRAAGMRKRPVATGALRPRCPRGLSAWETPQPLRMRPDFRTGIGGATAQPLDRLTQREGACPSGADHRESEAQSFRSDPWAAVRRARLNPMQPVPDSGDGNPPGFSA